MTLPHRWTRRGWVPQPIGQGNLAPTMADISVTGDSILHLAPEGRHVYSRATCTKHTKAPEGRHVAVSCARHFIAASLRAFRGVGQFGFASPYDLCLGKR